jgi:hypothetical protein
MARYPGFIGSSYVSQSYVTDQELTMNWAEERSESEGANSPNSLFPTPGYQSAYEFMATGGRANFTAFNHGLARAFTVYGSTLIEYFADGTSIDRYTTLAINENPATISSNGDGGGQLFITSGDHGYCYDLDTDTVTEVLTSGATQGGMLYGYFVAFDRTNSKIRISDLFDGLTWDPTQFAQRTIGPDPWNAMLVTPYGQIFLPGTQTGEFWYNAGTFPFPFAPDPAGLIEEGIAATFALTQAGKSPAWLSTNKNGGYQVQRAAGFSPQRISTHALEDQIAKLSRVSDIIFDTYEDRGHSYLLVTSPTGEFTACYDFTVNKWHNRGTWISENNAYQYSRPVFHCFVFGKHMMADRESHVLYEMDIRFKTDIESRPIRRMRRAPAVENQDRMLFFPTFEVLAQRGVGTQTGQGADPVFLMRKSNDYGATWSNEREASIGKIGQYWRRCIFWATGGGRGRVYEVSTTDPVYDRVTDAFLEIEASTESAA